MTLWVDLRTVPPKRRLPFVKAATAVGARFLLEPGDRTDALVLDGERVVDPDEPETPLARWIEVHDPETQDDAADEPGTVVVSVPDWKAIPLENLIARRRDRPGTLLAAAHTPTEARRFLGMLGTGVDGIVLRPEKASDISDVAAALQERARRLKDAAPDADDKVLLQAAPVRAIQDAGMAERVCIDTTTRFGDDEGILVGSRAGSLCLVLAETRENPWVPPRPFRVNAGALHQYAFCGTTTPYLHEAQAGTILRAVDRTGQQRDVLVGRAKIEPRPHVLVSWGDHDEAGSAVLQWAETVRIATPDGSVCITDLAPGDRILIHTSATARHTGLAIDAGARER